MHPVEAFLHKYSVLLLAMLKPLGFWGLGIIACIDASSLTLPLDFIVAGYVWEDPRHFWLYAIMSALGGAIGSLLPFLLGRAGGEIFLLKRINRQRYESLRDRFERQEFLALMLPAMMPPPTPFKMLVFAAGVFEMRIVTFLLAVFLGRVIRFTLLGLLVRRYGPQIVHVVIAVMHRHLGLVFSFIGILIILLIIYIMRKQLFRRGVAPELPADSLAE